MTCNVARAYSNAMTISIPTFSRERAEMIFLQGDRIEICAFPRCRPLRCRWRLCRNMVATPFLTGEGELCADQSVKMRIPTERLTPGFYDLHFTIDSTDTEHEDGCCGFGYRIEEEPIPATRPADFDAFWDSARQFVDRTPVNAAVTAVAEMADEEIARYNLEHAAIPGTLDPDGVTYRRVKVYKMQFDVPGPRRMYGWLAAPAGEGPFPGLLVLPGAGCGPLPMPVEHARHGYAALMLQIHGQDVDQAEYQQPPAYLQYLNGGHGERPEDDYYYGVFLACMQAARCLAGLPAVDPARLAVIGGSQGGFLSIVTAALCPEITAVVSALCFHADIPYRDEVSLLNARHLDGMTESVAAPEARRRYMSYFDAMHFAPRITVPTLMCACLCDTPSPVTGVHAVYRNLGSTDKEIVWSPGTNHDVIFAFERCAWRWLKGRMA